MTSPTSKVTARLDNVVLAETPEGIQLELRTAGLQSRLNAWLLDFAIRAAIYYAISISAALTGVMRTWVLLVAAFLLEWFYPVAFELSRFGATPGKRVLGLKVIMDNGLPVTPAASFARNLLRVADFLPIFYVLGACSMLLRHDFKRLGDLAAGTLVVHVQKRSVPAQLDGIEPQAPARALTVEQRNELLKLAARARRINSERLDELAALAAPACGLPSGTAPGPALTSQVLGIARWLLGARDP